MIRVSIPIAPMGAVRMTNRGKYVSDSAKRYLAYKDAIGMIVRKACGEPLEGPLRVEATFRYPIPASFNRKKREAAIAGILYPTVKPDLDNVIKGLYDAANGILWHDDKQIVEESTKKRYGEQPGIEIIVIGMR